MTIKTRMIIGIAGAIFFLLASNLVTQFLINETNRTVDQIIKVNGVKLSLLNQLKSVSDERAVLQRNLVLLESPEDKEAVKVQLGESAEAIFAIFEQLNALPFDARETELYAALRENMQSANAVFGSFMMAVDEEFTEEAIDILTTQFQDKYQDFTALVKAFRDYESEQNEQAVADLYREQDRGELLIWSWLALSVVLFSVVGMLVARSFLKPINAMVKTVETIRQTGELSHQVPVMGKDELAHVAKELNVLFGQMDQLVGEVVSAMGEAAQGHFDQRVLSGDQGQFLELKNGVNQSITQIHSVMGMLQDTASNFRKGRLQVPVNDSFTLKGTFAEVLQDLDQSAIQMKATVEGIAKTLKALSQGNFSVRADVAAEGDFIALKESINLTLKDLERFVDEVAQVQTQISEGDLTQQVCGDYKGRMAVLKDALNSSTANMALMVAKVGTVSEGVATGADSLAQGNQNISQSIQQQAAALEETSATMEQMTSTVRHNADNAQQANEMSSEAQARLKEGLVTMQEALNSMSQMTQANQKINDIITLIDGIAFQTNLLALNAAVEAARAGEHGRGFAVVASEVRNLAGKSAEAAGEIKGVIENSVKISQATGQYVQQTSDVMTQINESIQTVGQMIAEISQASVEQAQGIEQVNQTVASMDQMTQKNAAVVEQAAGDSRVLQEEASALREQVARFKVDAHVQRRSQVLGQSEQAAAFEKMIEAHQAWKSKIRAFVEGMETDLGDSATDHTACSLGKWFYGEGQQFAHWPQMSALEEVHRKMHEAIQTVVSAKQQGDYAAAEAGMEEMGRYSDQVVAHLYDVMNELG